MLMMIRLEIVQTRVSLEMLGTRAEGALVPLAGGAKGPSKAVKDAGNPGEGYRLSGFGPDHNGGVPWLRNAVLRARAGKVVRLSLPDATITLHLARPGSPAAAKPVICQYPFMAKPDDKLRCEPVRPLPLPPLPLPPPSTP